ncbi:MAG: HAD-IIA family hydrolase [Acidobacteriota bacterium]
MFETARGLIIDLDGTVYRGSEAVPGAVDFLTAARDAGMRLLYATNRSSRTPEVVRDQLRGYGLVCERDEILTSAQATAAHLPPSFVHVIGGSGLRAALTERGHHLVDTALEDTPEHEQPDAVIVGYDPTVDYAALERAMRFIRAGARFIGTNADVKMNTDTGLSPGNGAILAALETCSGVAPEIVGKPSAAFFETAITRLGISRGNVWVIGDSIATDIRGALGASLPAVLLLTGVSTRDEAEALPIDHVVETWSDIAALLLH